MFFNVLLLVPFQQIVCVSSPLPLCSIALQNKCLSQPLLCAVTAINRRWKPWLLTYNERDILLLREHIGTAAPLHNVYLDLNVQTKFLLAHSSWAQVVLLGFQIVLWYKVKYLILGKSSSWLWKLKERQFLSDTTGTVAIPSHYYDNIVSLLSLLCRDTVDETFWQIRGLKSLKNMWSVNML